jgi:hypothetical protein
VTDALQERERIAAQRQKEEEVMARQRRLDEAAIRAEQRQAIGSGMMAADRLAGMTMPGATPLASMQPTLRQKIGDTEYVYAPEIARAEKHRESVMAQSLEREQRNAKLQEALASLPESERERLEPVVRASFAGVPANVAQVMFAPREEKQALQPWAKEGFATEKEYLAYKKREKEATALPKDGTEGGPKFGEVASLRKEFNTESRPYKTVNDALKIIESLGTKANPTPQDIQALTYAFVKVQDPTSVVRETEYANAERAIALADKVGSLGTRIVQGQRLSPTQRKDMVNTARALRAEAMARYGALANSYEELAGSFGMNPKTIVPNRLDRDVNPAKDGKERLPGETAAQFLARTGGKR